MTPSDTVEFVVHKSENMSQNWHIPRHFVCAVIHPRTTHNQPQVGDISEEVVTSVHIWLLPTFEHVSVVVAVWHSDNALVLINSVTLCQAWLILGWVNG